MNLHVHSAHRQRKSLGCEHKKRVEKRWRITRADIRPGVYGPLHGRDSTVTNVLSCHTSSWSSFVFCNRNILVPNESKRCHESVSVDRRRETHWLIQALSFNLSMFRSIRQTENSLSWTPIEKYNCSSLVTRQIVLLQKLSTGRGGEDRG